MENLRLHFFPKTFKVLYLFFREFHWVVEMPKDNLVSLHERLLELS